MFINQINLAPDQTTEPDWQPIGKHRPRAAILFGPPGTSKTTIVKALAGCLSWDYIELHASHFVAEGLPNVQKTADRIFRQLAELDHAVVLFDEIDELVRERDIEKDAFGRFLTTSMLPKLAELWEARKILYFVATNHIEYFDKAIIRSQRFDAVLFISPPSFESKVREVIRILRRDHGISSDIALNINKADIDTAFENFRSFETFRNLARSIKSAWSNIVGETDDPPEIPRQAMLAKFVLLRFDELGELALNLKEDIANDPTLTAEKLARALSKIQDSRWRGPAEYSRYLRSPSYERLDLTKERTWVVRKCPEGVNSRYLVCEGEKLALVAKVRSLNEVQIPGYDITRCSFGRVVIVKHT